MGLNYERIMAWRPADIAVSYGPRECILHALLCRLTGDENPLHADPERARAAGFPRPILHGGLLDDRADRLASISAHFSRPIFPGESVRTEMWIEPAQVTFQCRVVERDEIVPTNGLATLRP